MSNALEIVKLRIEEKHRGDAKQLEVIFSPSHGILVEAPAGYGKTNTMVSKIAFMIVSRQIPNPKRLLALTFSVNAAYKIKKDVARQLPELLAGTSFNTNVTDKIFVSNYHGFCRNVLKKYGRALHPNLQTLDDVQSVDDGETKKIHQAVEGLSLDEAEFMSLYSDAVKSINEHHLRDNLDAYCDILIKKLLPLRLISYNGILTLTLKLFQIKPKVLEFYQKYFSAILVDEYQDTNLLSFWLVRTISTQNSRLIVLGDSLQRIYGFIGAVPDLLQKSQQEFGLEKITLAKNYRFASNEQMLLLDSNIRRNAENPYKPQIERTAKVQFLLSDSQTSEASEVLRKSVELLAQNPGAKVAILVKQRSPNVDKIIDTFRINKVAYFYGLFTDEDTKYIQFHKRCQSEFLTLLRANPQVTKKVTNEHLKNVTNFYNDRADPLINALINLLEIFWTKLFQDFSSFSSDEKTVLVKDTFEHNGLKQYIEFIATNIIVSTVHAAKGLEWDYVILPDMEQDSFPNWMGLCGNCGYKANCKFVVTKENEEKFLEELSVFYVAVTRARKQVIFTASKTAVDKFDRAWKKNISCFLFLKGISI